MASSSIEWTEMTWNPTTGCNKVSAGCKNCYAETMSKRLYHMGIEKYKSNFDITIHESELLVPYTWSKPKIVFVNSMSDLFHEKVPLSFIKKVFEVMNNTPHNVYQVLTKRSARLLEIHNELKWTENIWMGVSIEDERVSDRLTHLAQTNAKVKFLSCEPLIGEIVTLDFREIDWVIVGGESGHRARPIKKEWIIPIKETCDRFRIPFFFKQWGKKHFNTDSFDPTIAKDHPNHAKGGCQLDGQVYREIPNYTSVL